MERCLRSKWIEYITRQEEKGFMKCTSLLLKGERVKVRQLIPKFFCRFSNNSLQVRNRKGKQLELMRKVPMHKKSTRTVHIDDINKFPADDTVFVVAFSLISLVLRVKSTSSFSRSHYCLPFIQFDNSFRWFAFFPSQEALTFEHNLNESAEIVVFPSSCYTRSRLWLSHIDSMVGQ